MDKTGVFICSGCGIGDALDLDAVGSVADERGATTTLSHPCLCDDEGLEAIRSAVAENSLDSILVAACSDRAKAPEFDSLTTDDGPSLARVVLREQCTWSHPAGEEDTQMLAEDLVRMGLARIKGVKGLQPLTEEVDDTVLVVGGGRAGLEAAKTAAAIGHPVILVEKADALGGRLAAQKSIFPEVPPYNAPQPNPIGALVDEVTGNAAIRVVTSGGIAEIDGQPGQFKLKLNTADGVEDLTVGAIVQATGARPYDANRLGHLGYGTSADIITSAELETMIVGGRVICPSNGEAPRRVAFIQCAGSRDENHLVYCSSECCATTLRQVAEIRTAYPAIETMVVYKDLRTPGQMEHFYLGVQEDTGVMMTRGEVAKIEANGKLSIHLSESLLGPDAVIDADLVVLATGMVPNSADGEAIRSLIDARHRAEHGDSENLRKEAAALAEELKEHDGTEILNLTYRQGPDLPVLSYSFPDSHFICFPYETRRTGVYAAGTVRAPMDAVQAAEDGCGAGLKAVQCIEAAKRGEAVHPRAGDRNYPDFFLQRCTQCKRCTEECPFGTLNEDEKGTPEFFPLRCRRCGICMGSCPERIISFPDYSVHMVAEMIKAMEVPEDYEEKPRIVALLCENDALPALDAAAALGKQWNPWTRIIPIRCLGSTNIVWIAEALSRGIDGVILIGCKRGDDYQCHYVRGSELANTRLGNVGETLQRLALEPERIKVVELAHNEFERIPEVLDQFAEELDNMGPNPLKGF
jgi:quinone-modifying oxidoreductase subunit QmoB